MAAPILTFAGVLVLTLGVLAAAFVLGMRRKSPLVVGVVVGLSKRWVNPRQLRTAGTPGAYAGIVRHRGRRSGRTFQTPVGVVAVDDGFLIALPYGTRAQWVRNVLAAGSAALVTEGRTWEVDRPELVPMGASEATQFSASDQRMFRLLRTEHCLRLHRAREVTPVAEPRAPEPRAPEAPARAA